MFCDCVAFPLGVIDRLSFVTVWLFLLVSLVDYILWLCGCPCWCHWSIMFSVCLSSSWCHCSIMFCDWVFFPLGVIGQLYSVTEWLFLLVSLVDYDLWLSGSSSWWHWSTMFCGLCGSYSWCYWSTMFFDCVVLPLGDICRLYYVTIWLFLLMSLVEYVLWLWGSSSWCHWTNMFCDCEALPLGVIGWLCS